MMTARVEFTEPSTNADGTPLTDLASSRLYWWVDSGAQTMVTIPASSLKGGAPLRYDLTIPYTAGTLKVQMSAVDTSNNQSVRTPAATTPISGSAPSKGTISVIVIGAAGQQYGQSICTAAATGSPPTSAVVQRAPAGTTTWTTISPVLPMTGTPAVTAPYVDTTRVAGVSYQYRCLETNAAGSTPTDPSASFTFVDVATPAKGTIGVTIITQ